MEDKIINIQSNSNFESRKTTTKLIELLKNKGYNPTTNFSNKAELTICIGGDGAFLKAVHKNNFSSIPYVGINTGHLGFFQEISPENLETFVEDYTNGNYSIEELKVLGAEIFTKNKNFVLYSLNEIVLKAQHSKMIHTNIFVNRNHVEKFSGDGVLVSTPSGSSAYNYSSGGAIVYPSLDIMQLTPISPVNSAVYRVLQSSIIVPGTHVISLIPEKRYTNSSLVLVDGTEFFYTNLKKINIRMSNKSIYRLVFSKDTYWDNLKSKFL